jgi:uncharacterized RDD family membrane protein YckC
LRPLTPPGGYIWRANIQGSWQCHYKPFKRFACSWHLYGHRTAALMCLRDLWSKHLLLKGKDISECPIDGLFTFAGAAAVPAA